MVILSKKCYRLVNLFSVITKKYGGSVESISDWDADKCAVGFNLDGKIGCRFYLSVYSDKCTYGLGLSVDRYINGRFHLGQIKKYYNISDVIKIISMYRNAT